MKAIIRQTTISSGVSLLPALETAVAGSTTTKTAVTGVSGMNAAVRPALS